MLCICGKKEANIHLTEIVNGLAKEVHLCQDCADEYGTDFKTYFGQEGDVLNILTNPGKESDQKIECPKCHLSLKDFEEKGRLGCAECYHAFTKQLVVLMKRVHRSTDHIGKKPPRMRKKNSVDFEIEDLQEKLKEAIQVEAFEEAASLRDQIQELQSKTIKKKTVKKGPKKAF